MAKWFHPEINDVVDVFPPDKASEDALRSLGLYPQDKAIVESDESYEASSAILGQAQAQAVVQEAQEAEISVADSANDIPEPEPKRKRNRRA